MDERRLVTLRATVRAGLGLAVLGTAAACTVSFGGGAGAGDYRTPTTTPATAGPEPEPSGEPTLTPSPPPADAVSWETVQALRAADRGRYTEMVLVSPDGGDLETVLQETVRFDLEVPFVERTLQAPANEDDPVDGVKLLYVDGTTLVWDPQLLEPCGTPWIEVTEDDYPALLGMEVQPADLLGIRPMDILDWVLTEPVHLQTTTDGSTYEVTVPADVAIGVTGEDLPEPDVLRKLTDIVVVAEVLLPREGGSLEMTIDLTEAHLAIGYPPDLGPNAVVSTSWTMTADIPPFDTALPADVADTSCLDLETQT